MGYSPRGHKRVGHDGVTERAHAAPCLSVDIPSQQHRSKMLEGVGSTFAAIIIPFCAVSPVTPLVLILSERIY